MALQPTQRHPTPSSSSRTVRDFANRRTAACQSLDEQHAFEISPNCQIGSSLSIFVSAPHHPLLDLKISRIRRQTEKGVITGVSDPRLLLQRIATLRHCMVSMVHAQTISSSKDSDFTKLRRSRAMLKVTYGSMDLRF